MSFNLSQQAALLRWHPSRALIMLRGCFAPEPVWRADFSASFLSVMPSRSGFESEYPFASRFFDLRGLKYHALDEGTGEPLLCVHGNPTWSFAWRNIVREFSPRYRVLAVDHIGCGFSDKPAVYAYTLAQHIDNLCEFIVARDLRQITLLAHDWGGAIGMGAAARLPARFARFVLFNTAAFRSPRIPLRIALCRWPWLGTLALRGFNLFSRAALRMAVTNPTGITAAIRQGYLAPYDSWANRIAVDRFVKDIPLSPAHPSYATLEQVEAGLAQFTDRPMLLVWGMQDWCFAPPFLEEFQRRFPTAETLSLPQAGHYVFEDAPREIHARLHQFLEEHPLSGP